MARLTVIRNIYCVTVELSLTFLHVRIEVYRGKFEDLTLIPLAEQTLYSTAPTSLLWIKNRMFWYKINANVITMCLLISQLIFQ